MSQSSATKTRTTVRQYSKAGVFGLWAAVAVPMGLLAWVVAPAVAGSGATEERFIVTLIGALTFGLIYQFVLVMALVRHEQGNLRWSTLREALWLQPPTDRSGRRGGRLWWVAVAVLVGVAALELLVPYGVSEPVNRSFAAFVESETGQDLFRGNWALFALVITMFLFNTVLGEELLFRGLMLPRMRDAFGRGDWVVNGLLFGFYHLGTPWSIPSGITTGLLMSYAVRRWQSVWIGIIAHSGQSVFFTVIIFTLVAS